MWTVLGPENVESSNDDERDSLSAYDDNTSTLERMMTIEFNDDSQVRPLVLPPPGTGAKYCGGWEWGQCAVCQFLLCDAL